METRKLLTHNFRFCDRNSLNWANFIKKPGSTFLDLKMITTRNRCYLISYIILFESAVANLIKINYGKTQQSKVLENVVLCKVYSVILLELSISDF